MSTALSSPSSSRPKFVGLELVRFACAVAVCVFHAYYCDALGFLSDARSHYLAPLLSFAGRGSVAVFFVLSGFVIHYASRDGRHLGRYMAKRAIRIYPLFVVAIASGLSIYALGAYTFLCIFAKPPSEMPWQVLANLAMIQSSDFMRGPSWQSPILLPMWSLSYEFWFYVAFGLLIVWRGWAVRAWHVVVAGTLFALPMYLLPWHGWTFPVYFVLWWAGVELSRQFAERSEIDLRRTLPYAAALLIVAAECRLLEWRFHPAVYEPWSRYVGVHFIVGSLALVAATFRRGAILRWTPSRAALVSKLGAASYAIYLFHPIVIDAVVEAARRLGLDMIHARLLLMSMMVVLSVLAGLGLESFVHRPIASWLSRRIPPLKTESRIEGVRA